MPQAPQAVYLAKRTGCKSYLAPSAAGLTTVPFQNPPPNPSDAAKETSNLVFVTRASRTADIEQTLTLGVHGPKELHVILV